MTEELQVNSNERISKLFNRVKTLGRAGLVLAAGSVVAVSIFGGGAEAGSHQPKDAPTERAPTYDEEMVLPGDTIWDMTSDVENVRDRRDVMDWVEKNSPDLADGVDVGDIAKIPFDAEDLK